MWQRAAGVVRSQTPPTVAIGLRGAPSDIESRNARSLLQLSMRIGESMLATGAQASDVVATMLRLTEAYGIRGCHVDITFTSITVSFHRGPDEDPLTVMRVVKVREPDYSRLEALYGLVRAMVEEKPDLAEAHDRLDVILRRPHPYRRSIVLFASGILGSSVASLMGAGWLIIAIVAATATLMAASQHFLGRLGLPALFLQAIASAIPTVFVVCLYALANHGVTWAADLRPSVIVGASIVILVAGFGLVGATQDALDGYFVTAAARMFEVIILTLGIIIGVVATLATASRAGVTLDLAVGIPMNTDPLTSTFAAAMVAVAFAILTHTGPRGVLASGVIGALGWLIFAVGATVGLNGAEAVAIAAVFISFGSTVLQRMTRVAALAVTSAAIVPLLPGMALYRALYWMTEGNLIVGQQELLGALSTGLGLAAGLSVGTFLVRTVLGVTDRAQERALRRSTRVHVYAEPENKESA